MQKNFLPVFLLSSSILSVNVSASYHPWEPAGDYRANQYSSSPSSPRTEISPPKATEKPSFLARLFCCWKSKSEKQDSKSSVDLKQDEGEARPQPTPPSSADGVARREQATTLATPVGTETVNSPSVDFNLGVPHSIVSLEASAFTPVTADAMKIVQESFNGSISTPSGTPIHPYNQVVNSDDASDVSDTSSEGNSDNVASLYGGEDDSPLPQQQDQSVVQEIPSHVENGGNGDPEVSKLSSSPTQKTPDEQKVLVAAQKPVSPIQQSTEPEGMGSQEKKSPKKGTSPKPLTVKKEQSPVVKTSSPSRVSPSTVPSPTVTKKEEQPPAPAVSQTPVRSRKGRKKTPAPDRYRLASEAQGREQTSSSSTESEAQNAVTSVSEQQSTSRRRSARVASQKEEGENAENGAGETPSQDGKQQIKRKGTPYPPGKVSNINFTPMKEARIDEKGFYAVARPNGRAYWTAKQLRANAKRSRHKGGLYSIAPASRVGPKSSSPSSSC